MRIRHPGRTSSPFARRLAAGLVAALAAVALHASPAGAQVAYGWHEAVRQQDGARKPRDQRVRAVIRAAEGRCWERHLGDVAGSPKVVSQYDVPLLPGDREPMTTRTYENVLNEGANLGKGSPHPAERT